MTQAEVIFLWGVVGVAVLAAISLLLASKDDWAVDTRRRLLLFARVLLRVSLALAPFVAVAAAVIVGVILPLVSEQDGDLGDSAGALITGTVVAVGWLAGATASEYRQELVRDQTRRDTLIALRSEIFTFVESLDTEAIRQKADEVQSMIRRGGPTGKGGPGEYYPFSIQESAPVALEAVSADIPALDDETVAPIVRFYAVYTDLRSIIELTRLKDVEALSNERRVALHEAITTRRINALAWGLGALEAINTALGVDPNEKIARKLKANGSLMNPDISVDWRRA